MKRLALSLLVILALSSLVPTQARSETAIGVVFGYPGNAGLSLRFDRIPINVAWSDDFIHATGDMWMKNAKLDAADGKLNWYWGPGVDAGFPSNDAHDFFFAARVPIGLQYWATPKVEIFGEVAPGFQFVDESDFYWASSLGVRFVISK